MTPRLVSTLQTHRSIAVHRQTSHAHAPHHGEVVHDHSGLGVYLNGETRFWMRREYVLERGALILVPEGMPHMTHGANEAKLLGLVLCTHCMRGRWGETLRGAFGDVRNGGSAARRLDEPKLGEFVRLIEAISAELESPGPESELMIDGLMSQVAAEVIRARPVQLSAAADAGSPQVVTDALAFIETHASATISLADVARSVSRSPAYLATLMKQHTGRSVVDWITHGRMALARQLLLNSDDGIAAVAEAVGYASPSHFHRTFRREHGVTPAQWREAHR